MSAKKGKGIPWRQTTIALREDILVQAQAAGLDINDLCNRALAGATGISYPPKKAATTTPSPPVIVAHDGVSPRKDSPPPVMAADDIHPVINADDPRAAVSIKQVPRPPAQKAPETLPGRVSSPDTKPVAPAPKVTPLPGLKPKTPGNPPEKKGKGTTVKKFVADVIIRRDVDEGHVTKDVLYQTFSRWCREHRITPVPDRRAFTTALKNQFAMQERSVDGEPSWINIRLK
jgi:hypothetical protein